MDDARCMHVKGKPISGKIPTQRKTDALQRQNPCTTIHVVLDPYGANSIIISMLPGVTWQSQSLYVDPHMHQSLDFPVLGFLFLDILSATGAEPTMVISFLLRISTSSFTSLALPYSCLPPSFLSFFFCPLEFSPLPSLSVFSIYQLLFHSFRVFYFHFITYSSPIYINCINCLREF